MPASEQAVPLGHSGPHCPPQPSSPQRRPEQFGVQATQRPSRSLQVVPRAQRPHCPPQPSSPQVRFRQLAAQPPPDGAGFKPDIALETGIVSSEHPVTAMPASSVRIAKCEARMERGVECMVDVTAEGPRQRRRSVNEWTEP